MKVTGILKVKGDTQLITDKFQKRDFVIEIYSESYPQVVQLQLTQDNCSLLDKFPIGQEIDCTFELQGRSWFNPTKNVTQYFNTIACLKIK